MGKLHEILAVEGELSGAYGRARTEAAKTFSTPAFFIGKEKVYQSFLDETEHDIVPPEHQDMTTTVTDKLNYLFGYAIRYYDAVLQKDVANQEAKADIVVDGKDLAKDVPATTLLGLETKLKQLREVVAMVPTLQAGVKWEPAEDLGKGVFRAANPVETIKTRTLEKFITVAEATKEHPADVRPQKVTENAGRFTTTTWCGMLTSARKAEILQKLDKVARGVKQARQRANCVEVKNVTVAKKLLDYVMS